MSREVLRVANFSGFYGDRMAAARQMVEGGDIDFLTGDYLAELTMAILLKAKQKDAGTGFAATFIPQVEALLGEIEDRGIRVVVNAGGLNPRALAHAMRRAVARLGRSLSVVAVDGDDLLDDLPHLQAAGEALTHLDTGRPLDQAGVTPLTANVYLGAWPIVEALRRGADVVICPRVADAALLVGPAAWHFDWQPDDWDALAGATAAGHVVECGPQATGGNFAFFTEVPGLEEPGFPLAEIHSDGSSVITKHPGTGGAVTVETVTAQLLYEISDPAYMTPDVVAHFDTLRIAQEAPDRVLISGTRGSAAPPTLKLGINYRGGYRNSATFHIAGLDLDAKAALIERTVRAKLAARPPEQLDFLRGPVPADHPRTVEEASTSLRVEARDADQSVVGRLFSNAIVEMALSSYPGLHLATPPSPAKDYAVYWPALVPRSAVRVVLDCDGTEVGLEDPLVDLARAGEPPCAVHDGNPPRNEPSAATVDRAAEPVVHVPLGLIAGARSGDKGGNANVGVWVRHAAVYEWLHDGLGAAELVELLPELADYEITRFAMPNLLAVNFVVHGFLGDGVASSTRFDPQAKSLGEVLRARPVALPASLAAAAGISVSSRSISCGTPSIS